MLQAGVFEEFLHYARTESTGKLLQRPHPVTGSVKLELVSWRVAETLEAFTEYMVSFCKEFGVGKAGLAQGVPCGACRRRCADRADHEYRACKAGGSRRL